VALLQALLVVRNGGGDFVALVAERVTVRISACSPENKPKKSDA
jgi:hypothetical protein